MQKSTAILRTCRLYICYPRSAASVFLELEPEDVSRRPADIEFRVPYSQQYLVSGLVGLGLPYGYDQS